MNKELLAKDWNEVNYLDLHKNRDKHKDKQYEICNK